MWERPGNRPPERVIGSAALSTVTGPFGGPVTTGQREAAIRLPAVGQRTPETAVPWRASWASA